MPGLSSEFKVTSTGTSWYSIIESTMPVIVTIIPNKIYFIPGDYNLTLNMNLNHDLVKMQQSCG
jgi:hypothetical protein